jgi:hypothetical protein
MFFMTPHDQKIPFGLVASLKSDSVKNPPSETTFTFVVDNVVLSGWDYDPSANVEISDSTGV